MRKSQFIFVLMLSTSFATMARADDTSYANCVAAVGASNCEQIGTSGTYYALSGDEGNQMMTIYGTNADDTAATVPAYAFCDESLDSTLPEGVTSLKTSGNVDIGEGAFWEATGLTGHLDLTGVKTIGEMAFYGTTGLTSVDLTGVKTIGDFAFQDATGLTSANLTGVQTIGESAFEGDTGLTSVNLTGVQTIGNSAFYDTNLTSVNLTGVQTIENSAFRGATGLTSVVISDSLLDASGNITGIGSTAFSNTGLNTIYCPKDKTCGNSFTGVDPDITSYSKNDDGTYSVGENMYANADMMTKNIACENADQCAALQTALNAGNTCATQDACNTLAAGYATPQPTKPQRADIRIYTIDEANAVAKPTGNTVRIKYR